ncbi:MAG: hypothetical protein AAGN66_14635, partial [Acidobacteriota bacterium]
ESLAREALDLIDPSLHPFWVVQTLVGDILRRQGRTAEAERVLTECVRRTEEVFGAESDSARQAREALAAL